ncbi:peptidase M23 [Nocardioides guangzhouensis]|uniref:Peptidase M23 n=1 Tax=Nocardioides guangzhouensis TaxID=2497878 RepID=A0A4Q4ZI00_9ACTN|nr:peptidoglycan DD-metalloendopeptidase family protein [Nocardioides guangzhouensis]RYP87056.1 peptidase M23 [Nocardioides guangzhouensis]
MTALVALVLSVGQSGSSQPGAPAATSATSRFPAASALTAADPAEPVAGVDDVDTRTGRLRAQAAGAGSALAGKVPEATPPTVDLSGLSVAQLQARAARTRTEFIKASMVYEQAASDAAAAKIAAEKAETEAAAALAQADEAGEVMGQQVEEYYTDGISSNALTMVLTNPDQSINQIYAEAITAQEVLSTQSMTVEVLDAERKEADVLSQQATELRSKADDAAAETEVLLKDIQVRAAKVASTANAALAAAAQEARFADAEQRSRNQSALKAWQRYLKTLDGAHVVPPRAKDLDRKRLPYRLAPLTVDRKRVTGIASVRFHGKRVPVLPAETVDAVSRAFADLGRPYVSGKSGPDTFDCSGLVRAAWQSPAKALGADPVDQFRQVTLVPAETAQVGDLVFFADPGAGVQHVGINLGGRLMLAADATSSQVGVREYPGTPYAVGRVTLPRGRANAAPSAGGTVMRCGAEEIPASASGMEFPLEKGSYRFTGQFGDPGARWSSGFHTGLDFAAPVGTPVHAAKTGTVTVSKSPWGGPNLVSIDHGDGLSTLYAHMSYTHLQTGDHVNAGQIIGQVGGLGNATGPHLHFEVRLAGHPMDPMIFLAGGGAAAGGWGGHANGMIPASALCGLQSAAGHRLRCDAAHAFDAMSAAYAKANGGRLCITDSYRSYAQQVRTYAKKPVLGAVPGTSNHGWGLAVDLCGGIESFRSPKHAWMVANAGRFGYHLPGWARAGGSKPEPWHWEFGRAA